MDITKWPTDRILQLPDCNFGRKWPVGIGTVQEAIGTYYDISETALPEACLIWRCYWWLTFYATTEIIISLALGDKVPTTDAEFDAMEPILRNVGVIIAARRTVTIYRSPAAYELELRIPVAATGRRLVGRFEWTEATKSAIYVNIIISSIPKEIPDCMTLGLAKGR